MKKGFFLLLALMLGIGALQGQAFADGAVIGAAPAQNIVPGAIVQFGSYVQDNDGSRLEPIDWYVLATEGDKCLLLSKYALTRDFYQMGEENVTWETSDIRAWLNSVFISEAFTQTEQNCLVDTLIKNSDSTYGGNDTIDRVFLLSVDEARFYFVSDAHRRCAETAYAKEQEVLPFYASEYTLEGEPSVWWWLRTTVDRGNWTEICSWAEDTVIPVRL